MKSAFGSWIYALVLWLLVVLNKLTLGMAGSLICIPGLLFALAGDFTGWGWCDAGDQFCRRVLARIDKDFKP